MHSAVTDLGVDHLWVVYPGRVSYSLDDKVTVTPLDTMLEQLGARQSQQS
jgi:hypothetical protein